MTVANPPFVVLPQDRTEFDRLCQSEPRLSALLDSARLGNRLIDGVPERESGRVARRERLGGILSYYREAA